ncbi:hypothetical protein GCM10022234_05310 [Aeromicrobium panaciterrae]
MTALDHRATAEPQAIEFPTPEEWRDAILSQFEDNDSRVT